MARWRRLAGRRVVGFTALGMALSLALSPVIGAGTAHATATQTVKIRARVDSTSDWTWVRFSNATLLSRSLVAHDAHALNPVYLNGRFGFSLPAADVKGHAFRSATWALTLRVSLGTLLKIGIERGCDGTTAVTLYNANGASPIRVGEVEGTGCSGVSWSTFPVTSLAAAHPAAVAPPGCAGANLTDNASTGAAAGANPNILIAQDNLWFHGLGPDSGFGGPDQATRKTLLTPALGFYDSNSRSVSEKQIELSSAHGVDALSQEWIAPAGEPGSMEDQLDGAFLKARNLCRTRWAIFYDFNLRLQWKYGIQAPINFDDPRVHATFVADFVHFAQKYFGGRYYLKLDGRPMVEIWDTWGFTGNVDSAVDEARAAVAALGYNVYIVGDEQTAQTADTTRIARWDAVSSFTPLLMPGSPFYGTDHGSGGEADVAAWIDSTSTSWDSVVRGVTARSSGLPVSIQPGFAPQYKERFGSMSICAASKDDFVALARVAYNHAVPVGASQRRLVWVGTWNNYPEYTQIEPTIAGHAYPCGNTGTDILDALVSVFGRSTFGHP